MRKSYKLLKKVIDKVGVKAVANHLKVSNALVYKWCQDPKAIIDYKEASGANNPLDRIAKIYELTNDRELINWVCQMADGYYVPNPATKKSDLERSVVRNTHKIIKEFSETLDAISQSYNNEKRIDSRESKRIRKEWEDLKCIGERFVKACEDGKFNKKRKT